MLARTFEILLVALRLGLTSFGGPVAHLGYFRQEYVASRKWLDERTYADLVALCQFLPGPTSSQVGIAVGISRGGLLGGFAAWLGFTLPSAAVLILFAYGVGEYGEFVGDDWLRGLKIVAVAVVALAVWEMARTLAPDRTRATIAIATAIALLLWQSPAGYVVLIVASGLAGWFLLRREADPTSPAASPTPFSRYLAIAGLCLFFILLLGLPLFRQAWQNDWLDIFDGFYRSGSMVFGGGHVVLPLLQSEVVTPGWVTNEEFIAGYGAAQAIPGPLFTFSAYLGTVMGEPPGEWTIGLFALAAIFLPSFLYADRRAALLGPPEVQSELSGSADRGQRRGRRPAGGGVIRPGLDDRHTSPGGPCVGHSRVRPFGILEMATLARGSPGGGDRGTYVHRFLGGPGRST